MDPLRLMLMPARLGLRALDDLHALATSTQTSLRERDDLLDQLQAVRAEMAELNRNATAVCGRADELLVLGRTLQETAGRLRAQGDELAGDMAPVSEALDQVQEAGETIEEVAQDVRPLRAAAGKVQRVAERLTPGRFER